LEPLRKKDPKSIGGFTLIGRLGSGGMGVVYLATKKSQPVALKIIRDSQDQDEVSLTRFRREIEVLQGVKHPNIAGLVDVGLDDGTPWFAVQFINGPNLLDFVNDVGPLEGDAWWKVARGVLSAIRQVHSKGVVHRDMKPQNIIISDHNPFLIDFGIAHLSDSTSVTSSGIMAGTPAWFSPEQIEGGVLTEATDVFSIGSILMFAATGRTPWGQQSSMTKASVFRILTHEADLSGLDQNQTALVSSMLAKDPNKRPSVNELLAIERKLQEKRVASESKDVNRPRKYGARAETSIKTTLEKAQTKQREPIVGKIKSKVEKEKKPIFSGAGNLSKLDKSGFLKRVGLAVAIIVTVPAFAMMGLAASQLQGEEVIASSEIKDGSSPASPSPTPTPTASTRASEKPKAPTTSSAKASSFVMPDFVGGDLEEAKKFLTDQGIMGYGWGPVASSVPRGKIASTTPPAGTVVDVSTWNASGDIFIGTSSGSNEPVRAGTLKAVDPRISWSNYEDPNYGNWGFQAPTITDGVLWVDIDARFPVDTTILLGNSCGYLIEGELGLGCFSDLPSRVEAKSGLVTSPIRFGMNIQVYGIQAPLTFQINLKFQNASGVFSQSIFMSVSTWE
jgi:serine/threonine protein kinase